MTPVRSVHHRADQPLAGVLADPVSGPGDLDRQRPTRARWHPRTRLVLMVMVLPLLLSTGVLAGSGAASSLEFSRQAEVVAADAAQLEVIASARAVMHPLQYPMNAVSLATSLGVSLPVLETVMKPTVPFADQMTQGLARLAEFPTFQSTPALRADVAEVHAMVPRVLAGTVPHVEVKDFLQRMENDVDAVWYAAYDQLQADISDWQPPGSFALQTSALRQTFPTFANATRQIGGLTYALFGFSSVTAKADLIGASAEYRTATAQLAGHLGPKADKAWSDFRNRPENQAFAATIQQALDVVVMGLPAPFQHDLEGGGVALRPVQVYLEDLFLLVTGASQDLRDSALSQATDANWDAAAQIAFLGALAALSLAGVVMAGRVLTRPLKRLAAAARQIHDGEFDLEPLAEHGPHEVVTTTTAFNDMAATLKAVESRAVALADEDLSHPELLVSLPGRTGQALQATLDILATRIGEREQQRHLLHEEATHDRLTGIFNRAAVFDFLVNDVARRREAGETVAVLFIDLDGLKPLNDTYGHEVGDTAIIATAESLLEATGSCDVVGRLGGDEFLVVLCHDHSADGTAITERIREALAGHELEVPGYVGPLKASFGTALAHCDIDTDPMELVRQADEAMYAAKRAAHAARDRTIV